MYEKILAKHFQLEMRKWGQDQRLRGSVATLTETHENHGFHVSAEVKGSWPIAKSVMNVILILVAVLKPCKTFENELPDHF